MENEHKRNARRIPIPVWIVAGIIAVALFAYGSSYIFDFGLVKDRNAATDIPNETEYLGMDADNGKKAVLEWYESTIDKLETRVDAMEKMTIEGGELQDSYQEHLNAMEEELDTLRSHVKQIRRATDEEWEALKMKVEETRARIEDKLQNDYRDYSVSIE